MNIFICITTIQLKKVKRNIQHRLFSYFSDFSKDFETLQRHVIRDRTRGNLIGGQYKMTKHTVHTWLPLLYTVFGGHSSETREIPSKNTGIQILMRTITEAPASYAKKNYE